MTQEAFSSSRNSIPVAAPNSSPANILILAIGTALASLLLLLFFKIRQQNSQETPYSKVNEAAPKTTLSKSKGKASNRVKTAPQDKKYSHCWLASTLKAHSGNVLDVDFAANKKYVASCADDTNNRSGRRCQKSKRGRWLDEMLCVPLHHHYVPLPPKGRRRRDWKSLEHLPDAFLYCLLRSYVATDELRTAHRYPVSVPELPDVAYVQSDCFSYSKQQKNATSKSCSRCGVNFNESNNGQCTYHWGKLRKQPDDCRQATVASYSCCLRPADSQGCEIGDLHVTDNKQSGLLEGFVTTRSVRCIPHDGNFGVCALDCEMCFTTEGLEVARVTVLRIGGTVLYDKFVKPIHPVVDYNTRFSGLTAADLEGVSHQLPDVQRDLLELLNADTILIGHGLENDLLALRLLHRTVVDTAILFPHHLGVPYRRSLRTLVATHLHKEIQSGAHDSHEDARSSLQLVLWKLSRDVVIGPLPLHNVLRVS